jgi:para-nitrobenzyl esterase
MHIAAPSNAGLFQRAISESGGCTTRQRTKAEAEAAAASFATDLGCTGAGALACLRGKSTTEIMSSADVAAGKGFGPDVDGTFMPDQPRTLYDMGKLAKVPYLLGSNTDEGTLFLTTMPTTQEQYTAALNAMFCGSATTTCATASAVATQYMMSDVEFLNAMPNAATAALARVIGDSRLVCTTFDTAQRMSHAGAPVFMYNFDIPVPAAVTPPGIYLGATHGSELTSVFGTSPAFAADPQAKAASDLIQRYWTNFAKTGDSNGGTDPTWPAFTESMNVRMNLNFQPSVVTNFRADKCTFWQMSYALQFPPM